MEARAAFVADCEVGNTLYSLVEIEPSLPARVDVELASLGDP